MRKILIILPWLPYPITSGGHQALFSSIFAIKNDFDVYLAYEAFNDKKHNDARYSFLKILPEVTLLPFLRKKSNKKWLMSVKKILKSFLLKRKFNQCSYVDVCNRWEQTVRPLDSDWLNFIDDICNKYDFDIIQVEMPWMISQVLTLPKKPIKIFVHHELGFVCRKLESLKLINTPYVNAYKTYVDLNELALLELYDLIVTLSPNDVFKLQEKGLKTPVVTSFASIDVNSIELSMNLNNYDCFHLTFVGPSSHYPNVEGLKWFLNNCWEKLLSKDNRYKLTVVGVWSEKYRIDFSQNYDNIEFAGFVDSLSDYLCGSIMIVPITIGSGIRMKILESCAIGAPIVSTIVGAEGIHLKDGEDCFITDDPNVFVDDIIKLQDSALRKRFIVNARQMVKDCFSLEALRKNRLQIYNEILGAKN